MLIQLNDIEIAHHNMGPGQGCRQVLSCKPLGYMRQLGCENPLQDRATLLEELNQLAFDRFRDGKYKLPNKELHQRATELVGLNNKELIQELYPEGEILAEVVKRELMRRDLFNADIYRIGEYGDSSGKEQAMDLLLHKAQED